ncbi:carbonic anhydrase family protein [Propionivibrio sp.]|uniref:carbonic anhydrase n=1 Tax=Propionivibrio sp. TaxID=2212460 RepID=UPI00261A3EF7|nr:carbonic anhydrase family protein [Propionivibrio sp.]
MRTIRLIAILLPAFLLPSPAAQAAKWIGISSKEQATQTRNEVDASSINSASDGKLRIWHREIYSQPKIPDSGAFSFSRLTSLTEFQCDKRLAALIQRSYIAADGNELKNETFDAREPRPIAPDSSLEAVFNYACKHRSTPLVEPPPAPTPPTPAPVLEVKEAPKKNGKKTQDDPPPRQTYWSYTGNTGADKWGALDKEFAFCGQGQRQSPIDIRHTVRADLPQIQFAYKPIPLSIVDNGHSIKVDTPDAGGITIEGESYALQQFHFHKPSEEKLNGKAYAMAVHLEHKSKAGKLAVVAVMFEAGKEQGLIRTLWTNLPLEQNKPIVRPDIKIDPTLLLPVKRNYYTFLGSLTTPPCTEGVLWLVLKTPIQVSREQLAGFGTIYKNNVRPTQPVNSRLIKESR